jgi:hypothetical protein
MQLRGEAHLDVPGGGHVEHRLHTSHWWADENS